MSLCVIDTLAPPESRAVSTGAFHPRDPGLVNLLGLGSDTTAGVAVNTDSALGVSAWYAAVRSISEDVGKLPFMLYRRLNKRARERANDHPLWPLIHDDVSDEVSSQHHRECLQGWALTWGNGYSEIVRDGAGRPVEMRPLESPRVEPDRVQSTERGRLVYRYTPQDGQQRTLDANDVFHVKGLSGDGIVGWSVLRLARESIGFTIAAEQSGAAFFGNDSTPGGILRHPEKLSPEAANRLRNDWMEKFSGTYNRRKPAVLEEGMEWQAVGIPFEDAQLLQMRVFQVDDMARWFRMPPHKLQQLMRATFSNIEHQSIEYVTDTLMPWLKRWEHQMTRKVLRAEMRGTFFVEFLVEALLRGDSAARSKFYREMFNTGSMTRNEIRERENLNPIDDESGDTYYIQTNMGDASKIADAPVRANLSTQSKMSRPGDEGPADRTLGPSHTYLIGEALARMARIEHDKVKRAVNREKDFEGWLEQMHAEHVQHIRASVGGTVDAAADTLAWKIHGRELTDQERKRLMVATGQMAQREIERSVEILSRSVNRSEALRDYEKRCQDAATEWADQISEFVRSL